MNSSFGVRINKYLKVSLVIGLIDLLIFYIIGKTFNNMNLFNIIINKWQFITLFISSILLIIYFVDIIFFRKRTKKYKFLLIFSEPFKNWKKYIDENIVIKANNKIDFYFDIYSEVIDNKKISDIREDELLIRDTSVHFAFTNSIIIFIFFWLEKVEIKIWIYIFILLVYIVLNISYREYLKYYITEIYKEYLRKNKNNNK